MGCYSGFPSWELKNTKYFPLNFDSQVHFSLKYEEVITAVVQITHSYEDGGIFLYEIVFHQSDKKRSVDVSCCYSTMPCLGDLQKLIDIFSRSKTSKNWLSYPFDRWKLVDLIYV